MSHALEDRILGMLRDKPASGGRLIEQLQAASEPGFEGGAAIVFGALGNLAGDGRIERLAQSDGERVWGVAGDPRAVAAPPGFPPSFSLGAGDLAWIEKQVWKMTRGVPPHYFEELRRVAVADADRRVFRGGRLPEAAQDAIAALGQPAAVQTLLKRVEAGKRVPLRLGRPWRKRWLWVPLVLIVVIVALRLFVFGFYTIPAESMSMAPALMPAVEGGDRWVIADLVAAWWREPRRGEIWLFRVPGESEVFVKRVWGAAGETIDIRGGDLYVNESRVVKDRALLDRIAVPLYGRADLLEDAGMLRSPPAHLGFRNLEGGVTRAAGICRDVVVRAVVRGSSERGASIALTLHDGTARHLVRLHTKRHQGTIASGGVEVTSGADLGLPAGDEREIWITNADGVLRIELDGNPVESRALGRPGKSPWVTVFAEHGAELVSIEVARDLHFLRPHGFRPMAVGEGTVFLLGDNSPNSRDSRHFGTVDTRALVGRGFAVAWPPGRARRLR